MYKAKLILVATLTTSLFCATSAMASDEPHEREGNPTGMHYEKKDHKHHHHHKKHHHKKHHNKIHHPHGHGHGYGHAHDEHHGMGEEKGTGTTKKDHY